MQHAAEGWVEDEVGSCQFADLRLKRRFMRLLSDMSKNIRASITVSCADWASTKAAYRFLSNDRVSEREILEGHFRSTRERCESATGPILVLHDTTEFTFKRTEPRSIGLLKAFPVSPGIQRRIASCGILMHSSLSVTASGLPLGLGAIKFWTRDKFKGTNALKRKINPTRVPIEEKESIRWLENLRQSTELIGDPGRCVHIGDRESDIYELFSLGCDLKTNFLFRTCVDRIGGDGTKLISKILSDLPVMGHHHLQVIDKEGEQREAHLEIKYASVLVHPPVAKQKKYRNLQLTVIEARERTDSKSQPSICWRLISTLRVDSLECAIEKLEWYATRWKIEIFHKILKSGCRAEESQLRTAERLTNLIAIFCVLSWRVFWLTMLRRESPNADASAALTEAEIQILGHLASNNSESNSQHDRSVASCVLSIAKLGGYLARASDPPPGNIVIWRGLARLTDIQFGFDLHSNSYG